MSEQATDDDRELRRRLAVECVDVNGNRITFDAKLSLQLLAAHRIAAEQRGAAGARKRVIEIIEAKQRNLALDVERVTLGELLDEIETEAGK